MTVRPSAAKLREYRKSAAWVDDPIGPKGVKTGRPEWNEGPTRKYRSPGRADEVRKMDEALKGFARKPTEQNPYAREAGSPLGSGFAKRPLKREAAWAANARKIRSEEG